MTGSNLWIFLGVLGFFHVIGNILLSRQLSEYIPLFKERFPLILILWLIPILGAFYTFRKIGSDFYEFSEPGNTGVTPDVMGMGELFNPNAKTEQVIEGKLPSTFDSNIKNVEIE